MMANSIESGGDSKGQRTLSRAVLPQLDPFRMRGVSDIGILGVLSNTPIIFHAHALVNGHDRPRGAVGPIAL